ncbi:MFS transporter [Thermaurantiacus sp.]
MLKAAAERPAMGFMGLWNLSFGFFGIQVGFALQNANVSRIFQSLGTEIEMLAFLWIAGPVTGLLVQPVIGYLSDRTWTRLGRRRPFFLAGALLASLALVAMPNSPALWFAAGTLWILDASLNTAMEPFRAFVGDMLPARQRTAGYAFQTAFIGAGAVVASLTPIFLAQVLGVSNVAAEGEIPPSVRLAFYLGAAALLASVLWTVVTAREFSPEEMRRFEGESAAIDAREPLARPAHGFWWAAAGALIVVGVQQFALDKPVYILGAALIFFGAAQAWTRRLADKGTQGGFLPRLVSDLVGMPPTMRRLALAQFFTWIALFIMWIYSTPVVTRHIFGATEVGTAAYNDGADWVGVMFAVYNGVAALAAFLLPALVGRLGMVRTHALCLVMGAAGYALYFVLHDPIAILGAMALVGVAWASILTMPYAILASTLPQAKLGTYMGLFNIFIVLPQLMVSAVMGTVMRLFFPGEPLWTMAIAALVLVAAALAMLRVAEPGPPPAANV